MYSPCLRPATLPIPQWCGLTIVPYAAIMASRASIYMSSILTLSDSRVRATLDRSDLREAGSCTQWHQIFSDTPTSAHRRSFDPKIAAATEAIRKIGLPRVGIPFLKHRASPRS